MKDKRCVICQIIYTPQHPSSVVCGNPICSKRRRNIKLKEEYHKRMLGIKIESAKQLLEETGYIVIPKINNTYRIILEPVEKIKVV